MRNLRPTFTMRKTGAPQPGDWFRIENKGKDKPTDIYIYDEIGFWGTSASDFVNQLNQIDSNKINVHLNSPGGEIFDGLAIYNSLKQHSAEITIYVDALAASAASFIAMAGDKVIMARNAQMMIHDGIAICYGNEADMLDTAATLSRLSNNIADIYSQKAGGTVELYRSLMREETWFDGGEAVTQGLADEVLDSEDPEAEKAVAKWDLSFFNFAGREHAESPTRVRERVLVNINTKETEMPGGQKNTTSQPEGATTPEGTTPPPAEPAAEPAAPATTEPAAEPETQSPTPADDPTDRGGSQNGVLINGRMVTDWQTIQNHIAAQNTALNTITDSTREAFVNSLSENKKILASDIDNLTNFAKTLTPEQYNTWSASYGAAPVLPVLGKHGSTPTDSGAPEATAEASKADQIEVLEGTVDMLSRSLTPEQLKNSKPFKQLEELRGASTKS